MAVLGIPLQQPDLAVQARQTSVVRCSKNFRASTSLCRVGSGASHVLQLGKLGGEGTWRWGARPLKSQQQQQEQVGGGRHDFHLPFRALGASASGAGDGDNAERQQEVDMWANSSLPPFFKKYARPPIKTTNWPLVAAGVVLAVVMRETIVAELGRWILGSLAAVDYMGQALAASVRWTVETAGEPLAILLTIMGWLALALQDAYAFIIDMTPVAAVLSASTWVSAVLSVGDVASVTDSSGSSPAVLSLAGLSGLAAVLGWISPTVYFLALLSLVAFQRLVRKTDVVAAVMPAAAALSATGEPFVKILAFSSFLGLAVRSYHQYASLVGEEGRPKPSLSRGQQPFVLLLLMSSVGISVAVNALNARRITWMIG